MRPFHLVCTFKDTIDPDPQGRYKILVACKDRKMWADPNVKDKIKCNTNFIPSSVWNEPIFLFDVLEKCPDPSS